MAQERKQELASKSAEELSSIVFEAEELLGQEDIVAGIKALQNRALSAEKMALLGEMSGNMAHEINNPLLVLSGYAAKIRKFHTQGAPDPQKMDKAIERVESMAKRIQKIIKGLLRFSRADATLLPEMANVADIVEETLVICEHKFKRSGVKFEVPEIDKNLNLFCESVPISQVILNLLGNAHDAIEQMNDPWIKLEVIETTDHVTFRVTDSGPGIPPDVQENIFKKFFTTKAVGKGTGLGLALCGEIVAKHQGRFSIDNNVKNTCFVVEIPKNIKQSKAS